MTIEDVTVSKCLNGWIVSYKNGYTVVHHEFGRVIEELKTHFKYPECDGA